MSNGGGKTNQKSLGDILVQMGVISEEDVRAVRERADASDGDVAGAIVADRLVAEMPLAEAICTHLSLPFIHADRCDLEPEAVAAVPVELQKTHHFAVVDRFEGIVVLATGGVLSHEVIAEVEKLTGCRVQVCVTTVSEIRAVLQNIDAASAKKKRDTGSPPESDADVRSEAALREVLGTGVGAPPQEGLLDTNVISEPPEEPGGTPPSMTKDEEQALLEDDEVSQEADELFADLQRDLERFGPVRREDEDEEEEP